MRYSERFWRLNYICYCCYCPRVIKAFACRYWGLNIFKSILKPLAKVLGTPNCIATRYIVDVGSSIAFRCLIVHIFVSSVVGGGPLTASIGRHFEILRQNTKDRLSEIYRSFKYNKEGGRMRYGRRFIYSVLLLVVCVW